MNWHTTLALALMICAVACAFTARPGHRIPAMAGGIATIAAMADAMVVHSLPVVVWAFGFIALGMVTGLGRRTGVSSHELAMRVHRSLSHFAMAAILLAPVPTSPGGSTSGHQHGGAGSVIPLLLVVVALAVAGLVLSARGLRAVREPDATSRAGHAVRSAEPAFMGLSAVAMLA